MTLTFNRLTSNKMGDLNLSCTIHTTHLPSLAIIYPVVFVLECWQTHTRTHTCTELLNAPLTLATTLTRVNKGRLHCVRTTSDAQGRTTSYAVWTPLKHNIDVAVNSRFLQHCPYVFATVSLMSAPRINNRTYLPELCSLHIFLPLAPYTLLQIVFIELP